MIELIAKHPVTKTHTSFPHVILSHPHPNPAIPSHNGPYSTFTAFYPTSSKSPIKSLLSISAFFQAKYSLLFGIPPPQHF